MTIFGADASRVHLIRPLPDIGYPPYDVRPAGRFAFRVRDPDRVDVEDESGPASHRREPRASDGP